MAANDALERLYNSNSQEQSDYSLAEQMESASDDDFLEGMSLDSKEALLKSVEEVTIDTPEAETEEDEGLILSSSDDILVKNSSQKAKKEPKSANEALFNNKKEEKKPRKKYTPRTKTEQTKQTVLETEVSFNPIMDQLAKDIIDQLRNSNYQIGRFDNSQMSIVFDYMYKKF